jgi:hypothetical protein
VGKLQVHTIDQPESDITTFVISCNRLHLLRRTMDSFLATRDLVTKLVIVDDSGIPEVFDRLVADYGHLADIVCFPENRGLWWAKDFMTSFCHTPYIFYLEEDWLFLTQPDDNRPGYLQRSKEILEKHRHIGSVDLSWRTFEEEGYDSYTPELVEDAYFYKRPWQISPSHLHWFCWHGSPNLKRREDLILLGRVEQFYTEWNVDRKFYSLGLRGVFLKDRYVLHLGDHESLMAHKRTREGDTPETLYPRELLPHRFFPALDYRAMDSMALALRTPDPMLRSHELVLVTGLLDINREVHDQRNFMEHYVSGLDKLLELNYPLVIFVDNRYYELLLARTGGKPIQVIPLDPQVIRQQPEFPRIAEICSRPEWQNQAAWMQHSIIRSPDYIGLTLFKLHCLIRCAQAKTFRARRFYWIDAGICKSFNIASIARCRLHEMPEQFFMTRFPYRCETEMHGYACAGFQQLCGQIPDFVCRATLFGGTLDSINAVYPRYNEFLDQSLAAGFIGTEEAIFSGLALKHPELFQLVSMPNGDIKNYLNLLRG